MEILFRTFGCRLLLCLGLQMCVSQFTWAAAGSDDQLVRRAEAFVDDLQAGRFSNAVAGFDQTISAALPEAKLAATWQALNQQAGAFTQRHGARTETLPPYQIVLVTCEFTRDWLDTKVVFNPQGEIAGLFFLPARKPDAQIPPYAKADRFDEIEARFGAPGWELPGVLTVPKGDGRFPAIILVHGSGPNDRDETVGANKPFRDLAWELASRGIAVFRYDKRTKVHARRFLAEADQLKSITVRDEVIHDAGYALAWLRERDEVDAKRIFLLGHSLGGTLAPRIATDHPGFAGVILVAGGTRPLHQMMVEQLEYLVPGFVDEEVVREIAAWLASAAPSDPSGKL